MDENTKPMIESADGIGDYYHEKKFSPVLDGIKNNTSKLDIFNTAISGKIQLHRDDIINNFVQQAGCLPSEAEVVLLKTKRGLKLQLRKRVL